ncbi:MAG: TOBE domain-containing protein [Deltaproteobacteria bacterium]
MNLIPSNLEFSDGELKIVWRGDKKIVWRFSAKDVPAAAKKALKAYEGKEVIIGIRPQGLTIGAASGKKKNGGLTGKLVVHEFLGNSGIAQVDVGHTVVESVTTPTIPQKVGDSVSLSALFKDLHFFDPETTHRIEF